MEILKLESEAGLFANSATDAFTANILPVVREALGTCEGKVLVVANNCVEKGYTLKYIPEESAVFTSCGSEALPSKETLEEVKAVLRFSCTWERHKRGSRLLNEYLYFHLVHHRKDTVPFFVVELSLGSHAQKSATTATTTATTIKWWNSQDLQWAIYTTHFPNRLAFFFPISQMVHVTSSPTAFAAEAVQSKPRRIVLSGSRDTLLRFGHLFQSNERYTLTKRPSATSKEI